MTTSTEELREEVRRKYAEAAEAASKGSQGSCGSGSCCGTPRPRPTSARGCTRPSSAASCRRRLRSQASAAGIRLP